MKRIETLHLFAELDALLIGLLKSIDASDWQRPTAIGKWTVHDVAAHLLDGNLRTLSIMRDAYAGDPPKNINGYNDLVAYLNTLNAEWVRAYKRISPTVLIAQLESSGREYTEYLHTLDPDSPALFPVAWAGDTTSANWFHIAREFTEKWHHQQQIREACGDPDILLNQKYFAPVIETFMHALPHHWRKISAPIGAVVSVHLTGDHSWSWQLVRGQDRWTVSDATDGEPSAEAYLDPTIAWKLFTKALTFAEAQQKIMIKGDKELIAPIYNVLAVMG